MDTSVQIEQPAPTALRVERWPTEIPLLIAVVVVSLGLWLLFALSIFGIFYAGIIGAVLFFGHVAFIAHVRGSAVRLGPEQFPELHRRVEELSGQAGLPEAPAAYLMQSGGVLNALATKFLRARMIVLYSDLLEACGDNRVARDMIIGHELGHVRAGHLQWMWLLAPGMVVPFLGGAYSRAREYTCDRYGAALCGDGEGASLGLAILAAGGRFGPSVNLRRLAAQSEDLQTGWMTLGKWLSTHPPLADRVAALEPSWGPGPTASLRGPLRALAILASLLAIPSLAGVGLVATVMGLAALSAIDELAEEDTAVAPFVAPEDPEAAARQVVADFDALAGAVQRIYTETGHLPDDAEVLYAEMEERGLEAQGLTDPFDGLLYGYSAEGGSFTLWSSGPDGESGTEDDLSETFDVEGPEGPVPTTALLGGRVVEPFEYATRDRPAPSPRHG